MDFYTVTTVISESKRYGTEITVSVDFKYAYVKDIVVKGGEMYAFWYNDKWNPYLDDLITCIDKDIYDKCEELRVKYPDAKIKGRFFNNNSSKIRMNFEQYCKLMHQSDVAFNTRVFFEADNPAREDYSTNKLPYNPTCGDTPHFDELMNVLYEPRELEKILWFMGAILTNSMSKIQKFLYLYGGKGSGKGTMIKIFKKVFEGYHSPIDLHLLTSNSQFATSQVKEMPLVIDDDSDISKIYNDTALLKMTAHEPINVNSKYKQTYTVVFPGLLVTASNQRFQVRNIDSGITRRAIVASPTHNTVSGTEYYRLMHGVQFEIAYIAKRAIDVFNELGPHNYDDYVDTAMLEATDHIFAFVKQHYELLGDPCTLKKASDLYKLFLEDIGYDTRGYKLKIKNELSRYYSEYKERVKHGSENLYNVYSGFRKDLIFPDTHEPAEVHIEEVSSFDSDISEFDNYAQSFPAQYTKDDGTPKNMWKKVTTTLSDIDTTELHYVKLPENHIVIDFDLKDEDGNKNLELNIEAVKEFPETYGEISKSGNGIHLHYIYEGDVSRLKSLYKEGIEIKRFVGESSLRRKFTKSNGLGIARLYTGLPLKKDEDMLKYNLDELFLSETILRSMIKNNLQKKYHAYTKPSIDFIAHLIKKADEDGVLYDLSEFKQPCLLFALSSSNNKDYCLKVVNGIKWCNIEPDSEEVNSHMVSHVVPTEELVFYDVEVYPNLFLVCYKNYSEDHVHKLYNPSKEDIEILLQKPLVGFYNRKYDNHMLLGWYLGDDVGTLFQRSQKIVSNKFNSDNAYLRSAYELSYLDIYEMASKKQSLKKWEIDLGIKHLEWDIPWDQPVPDDKFEAAGEYCANDVIATQAVFDALDADYKARLMLSELSGLPVNNKTQKHVAKFLFGNDRNPQDKFVYTDLSTKFKGYKFEYGKSTYRGLNPSEGGYVYAEPGIHRNVALLDIESMHPSTIEILNYFGPYTERYSTLKKIRVSIKKNKIDEVRGQLGGVLDKYLDADPDALAYTLKIIVNIVYGMTSAKFANEFKHPSNVDNIVAKHGALFMIDLQLAVQEKGYTVAHIKTDSIKIPDATPEIIEFITEFGAKYGYNFVHEATYNKMALVNNAVYVAEYFDKKKDKNVWTAVGAQFAEPYVFKTLFSKEPIEDEDFSLVKSASSPIYLDDLFVGKVAQVYASNKGGGLYRRDGDRESAVTGTKGYNWSLFTKPLDKDNVNIDYYEHLVQDAVKNIKSVGDVETFLPDLVKKTYPIIESQDDFLKRQKITF